MKAGDRSMRNSILAMFTIGVALLLPATVLAQSPSASKTPAPSAAAIVDDGPVVSCPVPGAVVAGPDVSPDPSAGPEASVSPASWAGAWTPMPAAPLSARSGAATDIAAQEGKLYVWGGRGADGALLNDGTVFLVKEQRWEMLPATDLVPREGFGFDADGRGITIWGGVDAAGKPLDDGARLVLANDDTTMSWQALPPAPLTPGPASLSGDINITYAVTPGATAGDPPRFAVLDDDSGSLAWDDPSSPDLRTHGKMPAPRVPAGVAYEIAAPDQQDGVVLISYQADGTAIASWFTKPWPGSWGRPVTIPLPATAGCPAISLAQLGWVRADPDGSVVAYLTKASGPGAYKPTAAAPAGTTTGGMLAWSPSRLIVADALLAYDTVAKRWTALPALPDGPRTGVSAAWSGGKLYLWGGTAADGQPSDTGWMFTPATPPRIYPLAGIPPGDCGGEGDPSTAVFRAKESDPEKVWLKLGGQRLTTIWPEGYTVRFGGKQAQILAPGGTVVAREGQRLSATKLRGCMGGKRIFLR